MGDLIKKDDRFFVAGHQGMVGSAIYRALRGSGYENLLTASRSELDLLDLQAVENWFLENKPTVVILAAAKVGGIYANDTYPADFLLENLKIQTNVIETAWRSGVKRLLFLGSSCIYPKFAEQPLKEESLLTGCLESTNEWYAIAKIAGIKLCESLRKQYGFDAISLMPTNLYGPGDNYHPKNSHVMPALIRRFHAAKESGVSTVTCWGTGMPMREFLYVDDLADACVHVLKHWKPGPGECQFMNVGTGVDISIRDLAESIAKVVGFNGQIKWDKSKPDGTPRKQLNIDKLNDLGWSSSVSLSVGIKETVRIYEDQIRKSALRS